MPALTHPTAFTDPAHRVRGVRLPRGRWRELLPTGRANAHLRLLERS